MIGDAIFLFKTKLFPLTMQEFDYRRTKKGLSKNRWGLGVPLRNPGVDYPGEEKQLQTYMGRHSGLLFFVFTDYHAVRDINRKEKVQRLVSSHL